MAPVDSFLDTISTSGLISDFRQPQLGSGTSQLRGTSDIVYIRSFFFAATYSLLNTWKLDIRLMDLSLKYVNS